MKWDQAGHFSAVHFADAQDFPRTPTVDQTVGGRPSIVFVVDDDCFSRSGLRVMLEDAGFTVAEFADCEGFLSAYCPCPDSCLVLDVHFPGMGGLELLRRLQDEGHRLPSVVVSGSSDISEAVVSMKSGAVDFIEKPIATRTLITAVQKALRQSRRMTSASHLQDVALNHLAYLTRRQREVMTLVLAGHPSKNIAADLGISQRTVENHRASIMHKTGATSLPALSRLVIAASDYRREATANS